mgnify:CR=1 FL=1
MIMKRLIQPMLAELYADHWLDEFLLEGESLDIAWQIHKELQVFEPCGDDDNRTIWIEVPRGVLHQAVYHRLGAGAYFQGTG